MTYEVRLTPPARRHLHDSLPPSVAAAVVEFLSGDITREPFRVGKPLRHELEGRFSARRGAFRIIYSVHDETVYVEKIQHRRTVYR